MKPRLTIFKDEQGILQIFLNESCRDELIDALKSLDKQNDHLHFAPEEFGMDVIQTSTIPYNKTDEVFEWAKLCLRPDEWDKKYFPHVLET
jgi:hypothetical protein